MRHPKEPMWALLPVQANDPTGCGLLAKSCVVSCCQLMLGIKVSMEELDILEPMLKMDPITNKVYYQFLVDLVEAGPQ